MERRDDVNEDVCIDRGVHSRLSGDRRGPYTGYTEG